MPPTPPATDTPSTPVRKTISQIKATPLRISVSSTKNLPHTIRNVEPHLKREIKEMSGYVPADDWVKGATGVSPDKLGQWASVVKDNGFFADDDIAAGLLDFCKARREPDLYAPLSRVLNRLLVLAEEHRSKMKDLPEHKPIDDLVYAKHDANPLKTLEDQGSLGARRKPDLIGIRQRDLDKLTAEKKRASWDQAVLAFELKFTGNNHSMTELNARRKKDGLPEHGAKGSKRLSNPADDVPPNSQAPVAVASGSNTASRGSSNRKRTRADVSIDNSAQPPQKKSKAVEGSSTSQLTVKTLEDAKDVGQMGSYALEISASTRGSRLHCIGIYMFNHHITFWYIDSSGTIRTSESEVLSLFGDFEKVAAIFIALSYCTPEQLGAFPPSIIRPPEHTAYSAAFPPTDLENFTIDLSGPNDPNDSYIVTFGKNVFTQYALFGRRTCIYAATTTSSEHEGRVLAVKLSQQYETRTSEVELLNHARECGVVDHVPEVLKAKDFGKLSEDVRRGFGPTTIDPLKSRILRCIVTDHYVPLAEQLTENPDSLRTMVKQLLGCIHDLRYKAHILHRDVSASNIMYTQRDGQDWFVLIDFDLAVRVSKAGKPNGATAHDRTGTLPFMAHELLFAMFRADTSEVMKGQPIYVSSVLHCIRMDFESLTLVALWCAIMIVSKSSTNKKAEEQARYAQHLQPWETGNYEAMARFKRDLIRSPEDAANLPLSPHFKHLSKWFKRLLIPFSIGIQRSKDAELKAEADRENGQPVQKRSFADYETFYGEVTLEKILKSLEQEVQHGHVEEGIPQEYEDFLFDDDEEGEGEEVEVEVEGRGDSVGGPEHKAVEGDNAEAEGR